MREGKKFMSRIVSLDRVAHTKAGGRIISYRSCAIVGNGNDQVGWALSKASTPTQSKQRAVSKAIRSAKKIESEDETFVTDVDLKFQGCKLIIRRGGAGMGIVANSVLTDLLLFAGYKNGMIKTLGKPNINLLLEEVVNFLQGKRT